MGQTKSKYFEKKRIVQETRDPAAPCISTNTFRKLKKSLEKLESIRRELARFDSPPTPEQCLHLIPADIGNPISELLKIQADDLMKKESKISFETYVSVLHAAQAAVVESIEEFGISSRMINMCVVKSFKIGNSALGSLVKRRNRLHDGGIFETTWALLLKNESRCFDSEADTKKTSLRSHQMEELSFFLKRFSEKLFNSIDLKAKKAELVTACATRKLALCFLNNETSYGISINKKSICPLDMDDEIVDSVDNLKMLTRILNGLQMQLQEAGIIEWDRAVNYDVSDEESDSEDNGANDGKPAESALAGTVSLDEMNKESNKSGTVSLDEKNKESNKSGTVSLDEMNKEADKSGDE